MGQNPFGLITRDLRDFERIKITPFSDVHIGATHHDEPKFVKAIEQIKADGPSHRVLLLGDLADVITMNSVAATLGATTPQEEWDMLVETLHPIREHIDLAIPGNHERRAFRDSSWDFTRTLMQAVGVPGVFRSGVSQITYNLKTVTARGLCHHGHGGGRKPGAKLNRVSDLSQIVADADFVLMGHTHDQMARVGCTWMHAEPGKVRLHPTLYVITGCYLGGEQGMEPYAADAAYPPSWTGSPPLFIGDRGDGVLSVKSEIGF
jgi:predicted phosphodiesterase